jgi:hypothetical protein
VRAVHNLSKETRQRAIEVLLEKRSKKELAEQLGLSPASIVKFFKGYTHPSDITISRVLEVASDEERREIVRLFIDDLVDGVIELLETYPDVESSKLDELKKILEEKEKRRILTSLGFV